MKISKICDLAQKHGGQETEMNDKAFLPINFELCTVRLS